LEPGIGARLSGQPDLDEIGASDATCGAVARAARNCRWPQGVALGCVRVRAFPVRWNIAGVGEVAGGRVKATRAWPIPLPQRLDGGPGGGAQQRLELGEDEVHRVQVRAVLWDGHLGAAKAAGSATRRPRPRRRAHARDLVRAEMASTTTSLRSGARLQATRQQHPVHRARDRDRSDQGQAQQAAPAGRVPRLHVGWGDAGPRRAERGLFSHVSCHGRVPRAQPLRRSCRSSTPP